MMIKYIKEFFARVQHASFIVRALLLASSINILIFTFKTFMFGLKTYYGIHLSISVLIILFLIEIYVPPTAAPMKEELNPAYIKMIENHVNFMKKNNEWVNNKYLNLNTYCYFQTPTRWTWLFTGFCILHMISISIITLARWNCTMYVRISFAMAFFGFVFGVVKMRVDRARLLRKEGKFVENPYHNPTYFNRIRSASFLIQVLIAGCFINIVIFFFKCIMFGPKEYYLSHLVLTIILVSFLIKIYTPPVADGIIFLWYRRGIEKHMEFVKKYNLKLNNEYINLSSYCYTKVYSRWTWVFMVFCILHMVSISIITLARWNCTMYVRISFAMAFFGFVAAVIALKIQKRGRERLIEEIKEDKKIWTAKRLNFFLTKQLNVIREQHPYHILQASALPFFTSYFLFDVLFYVVRFFHFATKDASKHHLFAGILFLLITISSWLYTIVQEANDGHHTKNVRWNLLHAFILFIVSEAMLFFAIFWAFFHSSLSPAVTIFCMWPPLGIKVINPFGLPLLNTALLLSSGISLTAAHKSLGETTTENLYIKTSIGIGITLFYGSLFTLIQGFEYINAPFAINDGIYGSIFYFATGFHGIHVIIGSLMLLVSLARNGYRDLQSEQHVGFITSIWYWHFVDMVWVILFLTIYWWGS